jgi:SET domain-containing protein
MSKSKPYVRDDLVYVDKSPVHGKGLFARKAIPKGTELGLCKTKKAKKDGPYVLFLEDVGERRRVMCDLRFINHGKKPNVAYYDDLTVETLKKVKKGEELLHDYGDDWE